VSSPDKTDTAEQAELRDGSSGSDPEFVQALLGAHRQLEIPGLLQALLEPTMRWCGAEFGIGIGAGGGGRAFVPLAASTALDDPRAKAFERVEPEHLKQWIPARGELLDGFGPLAERVADWPGAAPAHGLALPVVGPVAEWAGLLFLACPSRPDDRALGQARHLLRMGRPAIANALRVLALRELVIKDDTARCFNRRHFEECLPEELARASRFRSPVSLIFLDLDNLKQVNNRFGHSMGSRTLYEVSVRIRSRIRKFDKLFRFGGDEFCIVLPETEWHGAMEVAERVRDAVAGKPFLVRELEDKKGIPMSASLGIASFPLHSRKQRDLVLLADRAMQKVKNSGKNAIGIAEIAEEEEEDDDGN